MQNRSQNVMDWTILCLLLPLVACGKTKITRPEAQSINVSNGRMLSKDPGIFRRTDLKQYLGRMLQCTSPVLIACLLISCGTKGNSLHRPAPLKNKMAMENILLWPLEGAGGAGRTANGLRQVFVVTESRAMLYSGQGPAVLLGGYILEFVYLGADPRDIDVGVQEQPCFPAERAADMTNAVLNPVVKDAHGVDRGRTYDAKRNGMWISFSTTPLTYKCVTAIHIRPIKERARGY